MCDVMSISHDSIRFYKAMINGHGDDIYGYPDVRMNFSSNICQHADHSRLKAHLMDRFDVVGNYPEPEACALERALARRHQVGENCVLVTGGATEAIYLIAHAYSQLPYYVVQPTFSEYDDACRLFGLQRGRGGLTWVCNPNNPTGEVRRLADYRPCEMLVVDQAYERYTRQPLLQPRDTVDDEHVILLHSMTKDYAVPGLRLGYVTAAPAVIARLRRYLHPWSVNALAIEAGLFLLAHDELLMTPDLEEAQRLYRRLRALDGVAVFPTDTNFMLCRAGHLTAAELKDRLARHHGMLIRDASNFQGLDVHHFRIAAQLPSENDALVEALENILHSSSRQKHRPFVKC